MKLKRFLALLLAIVMTVTMLAACGNKVEDDNLDPPDNSDPVVTEPEDNIPVIADPEPVESDPVVTDPEPDPTPAPDVTEPAVTEPEPDTTPTPPATTEPDKDSYTVDEMSAVMYATDSVNVRSGPAASYDRIGSFKKDEAVTVTGRASTGWYRVLIDGKQGFVSNAYLTSKEPANVPSTTEPDISIDDGPDDDISLDDGPDVDVSIDDNVDVDTSADWVKDNGFDYIIKNMKKNEYVTTLNSIMEGIQRLDKTIYIEASIQRSEVADFFNLIIPLICVDYCYVKTIKSYNMDLYDQGIIRVTVEYYVDNLNDANKMVSELRTKAKKVVSNLKSSWSDYQKIKYLHDWLVLNCTPDANSYEGRSDVWASNAYGSIVDGRPTCLGYAKGMFYLLNAAGFKDVTFGVGVGNEALHSWVKVKAGGKWYNIDPTWDDPLSPTSKDKSLIFYDYFMVTDEFMKLSHSQVFDMKFFKEPSATALDLNWHVVNGYYAKSASEAEKIILQCTKDAVAAGDTNAYVRIKFSSKSVYEEFLNSHLKNAYSNNVLSKVTSKYTCDTIWPGTKSAYPDLHTLSLTYKLVKN